MKYSWPFYVYIVRVILYYTVIWKEVYYMILGLDVSTSVIGISVIQKDGALEALEFVNLKKEKDLFMKALIFANLIDKYKTMGVTDIVIEEPLVMFQQGMSRAQIISKLSMFNGMIQYACYSVFGILPTLIHVSTARKLAWPGLKFPKGSDRKHLIWEQVDKMHPDIEWKFSQRGKREGLPAMECYDMADAFTVARARKVQLENE